MSISKSDPTPSMSDPTTQILHSAAAVAEGCVRNSHSASSDSHHRNRGRTVSRSCPPAYSQKTNDSRTATTGEDPRAQPCTGCEDLPGDSPSAAPQQCPCRICPQAQFQAAPCPGPESHSNRRRQREPGCTSPYIAASAVVGEIEEIAAIALRVQSPCRVPRGGPLPFAPPFFPRARNFQSRCPLGWPPNPAGACLHWNTAPRKGAAQAPANPKAGRHDPESAPRIRAQAGQGREGRPPHPRQEAARPRICHAE